MQIYGAGIAGLLAGCVFQTAEIFEAGTISQLQHRAVLRFRSPAVGDAVGVEFKKVRVHKGIFHECRNVERPTIQLANLYARKVVGCLTDRSIWNLDTVDRWIAPEDFVEQMGNRCGARIHWSHTVTSNHIAAQLAADAEPVISTLPMPVMAKLLYPPSQMPAFGYSSIGVTRFRIKGANVFQTVYFPSPTMNLYRASITGDLLIAESRIEQKLGKAEPFSGLDNNEWMELLSAFGLDQRDCFPLDVSVQRYGKILPIDDAWRKQFMFDLTHRRRIYSLGRFGTWRNLITDDVLHDLTVIKRLMSAQLGHEAYDLAREVAGS